MALWPRWHLWFAPAVLPQSQSGSPRPSLPDAAVTAPVSDSLDGSRLYQSELRETVYAELRAIAARKMASERPGHTLQPTALVHEAWLRLGAQSFENRAHFFAAAAESMRQILVDSARRKSQLKRAGDCERVEFCEALIAAPDKDEKLLLVHDALETLAREDPLKAEIVKLRYFVGFNHHEIAEVLAVNEKAVRRHWEMARVRLYQLISPLPGQPDAAGPAADDPEEK